MPEITKIIYVNNYIILNATKSKEVAKTAKNFLKSILIFTKELTIALMVELIKSLSFF